MNPKIERLKRTKEFRSYVKDKWADKYMQFVIRN